MMVKLPDRLLVVQECDATNDAIINHRWAHKRLNKKAPGSIPGAFNQTPHKTYFIAKENIHRHAETSY